MTLPAELLAELAQRGITLTATGDRLQVAAPPGALTAELREAISAQKPALLAALAPPAAAVFTGQTAPAPLAPAPRKNGAEPADPAGAVLDPADFTALREVLDRYGHFTPDPRDPPWADPRPDLVDDHARWWLLLEAAWRLDGQDPYGVYGALNGMRCCGARLELVAPSPRTRPPAGQPASWRLVKGDELSEEEYQRYRQTYLVPHTAALTKLLSVPGAASIAHQRPEPAAPPAPFTGRGAVSAAPPAPRKNGAETMAQQPLLAGHDLAPAPGGDW